MQGSMSQMFYLCPSLNFIKFRKSFKRKGPKSSRFFVIKLKLLQKKKKRDTLPCIVKCSMSPESFIHLYEILSEMCSRKKIELKNHILIHNYTIQ